MHDQLPGRSFSEMLPPELALLQEEREILQNRVDIRRIRTIDRALVSRDSDVGQTVAKHQSGERWNP